MTVTAAEQSMVLLYCIACGAFVGVVFDGFRILRKLAPSGTVLTFIEDLLFWIIAFVAVFLCAGRYNYGDVRWYMLVGAFVGAVLYFLTVSRLVLYVAFMLIRLIKETVRLILKPFVFILRKLKKPLIMTVNIGKKGFLRIFGKLKQSIYTCMKFYKHKLTLKKR